MPAQLSDPTEYQNIFHWAETQKDGTIPSFAVRKNDPYEVRFASWILRQYANYRSVSKRVWEPVRNITISL